MNRVKIFTYLILFSAVVFSCTERIDLPLDESSIKLVVEGAVTTDTAVHEIFLTETTGYYYNDKPPAVTGASVSITDGETIFELTEEIPGVYRTSSDFYGVAGKTYTLNISLAGAIGGFTDFSASATISKFVPLDSIGLLFYPEFGEQGLWEVKCWMKDLPTTDFYRFELIRNRYLITNKLERWLVTDDTFFNGEYVNGAAISYLDQNSDNEKLVKGDTLIAELNVISREYYSFIQDAQMELRGSNPLFSGPGANVRGNISNGAIGFFAAYPVSRAKKIVP
jgi:hypothetical protein